MLSDNNDLSAGRIGGTGALAVRLPAGAGSPSLSTFKRCYLFGEGGVGSSGRGTKRRWADPTKRHGEALITDSIEPGMVLFWCDMGEPRCPKNRRPQHLIEN